MKKSWQRSTELTKGLAGCCGVGGAFAIPSPSLRGAFPGGVAMFSSSPPPRRQSKAPQGRFLVLGVLLLLFDDIKKVNVTNELTV